MLAGFEPDCGATYFNLTDLQVRRPCQPCARSHSAQRAAHSHAFCSHHPCFRAQDEYKNEPGTVIAADFYGSSRLLPLSGERHVVRLEPHACLSLCRSTGMTLRSPGL